jgi:hypothetical protein
MSDLIVSPNDLSSDLMRFDSRDLPEQMEHVCEQILGRAAAKRFLSMRNDAWNTDSIVTNTNMSAFMARQLEYIYTQTYDIKRPEFKARKLIPVDTRVPSGAETYTYRQFEETGYAAVGHNYSGELPDSDVKASETPAKLVSILGSYHYSIQDMRAAAFAGVPLDAKKAASVRRAFERKLEILAAVGTSGMTAQDVGITGLTNAPGIVATTQKSTGTWIAQLATSIAAGVAAVITDINALTANVFAATGGVWGEPGTLSLLLPIDEYNALNTTPSHLTYNDSNLLETVLKVCKLKDIDYWNPLGSAGSGSKGRIMVYPRDPEILGLIISQEFEQFAPQPKSLAFQVPCHMRTGAVEVRYPLAISYMDGPGQTPSNTAIAGTSL